MNLVTPESIRNLQRALYAKAKGSPDYRFYTLYGVERWLGELAEDAHTQHRLRQWLCKKHKQGGQGFRRYPDEYLYQTLGLTCLGKRKRNVPWAKA